MDSGSDKANDQRAPPTEENANNPPQVEEVVRQKIDFFSFSSEFL